MKSIDPFFKYIWIIEENLGAGQWRHKRIVLSPDNKDFNDIVLEDVSGDDFRVVAEFVSVLE